ncbi:zinc ABC transporter substrate-binding protein [Arthrobacter sp. H5]|uniref:metal ABC transporter solute-binding protein, Zn/Mn family n=1 Tax=Arthrobacter sp. H5 TaxID=1267973 RepID=UPI0004851412|nr:zinc ABC transporter substrate-binding protein [Arthrobacter sp. H5]
MRRATARSVVSIVVAGGVALAMSGCGQSAGEGTAQAAEDGTIQVVTSTNVYGDIVETIGGDNVEVTAIVNSLSQDPHSYEATVQDKLAVSKAELLVENGGGYDTFLHLLADDVEMDHDYVLTAVDISGLAPEDAEGEHAGEEYAAEEPAGEDHADEEDAHAHGDFNEHVWYSLPAMDKLAAEIAAKLSTLDPDNAGTYEANAASFSESSAGLQAQLDELAAGAEDRSVAMTEPVPWYLLEAAGLQDGTPPDFIEAIEEGSDVPVAALNEMQVLMEEGGPAFLAYNQQTEGPQTVSVRDAAEAAGVPIVTFTETVPDGGDYITWMTANVDGIAQALNS